VNDGLPFCVFLLGGEKLQFSTNGRPVPEGKRLNKNFRLWGEENLIPIEFTNIRPALVVGKRAGNSLDKLKVTGQSAEKKLTLDLSIRPLGVGNGKSEAGKGEFYRNGGPFSGRGVASMLLHRVN